MEKEFTITIRAKFNSTGNMSDVDILREVHKRATEAINPADCSGLFDVGTAELGSFKIEAGVSSLNPEG